MMSVSTASKPVGASYDWRHAHPCGNTCALRVNLRRAACDRDAIQPPDFEKIMTQTTNHML